MMSLGLGQKQLDDLGIKDQHTLHGKNGGRNQETIPSVNGFTRRTWA